MPTRKNNDSFASVRRRVRFQSGSPRKTSLKRPAMRCTTKLRVVIVTMSCIRARVLRAAFLLLSFFILCSVVRAGNNYYGPLPYRNDGYFVSNSRSTVLFSIGLNAQYANTTLSEAKVAECFKTFCFLTYPFSSPASLPLVRRAETAERGRALSTANYCRVRISFFFPSKRSCQSITTVAYATRPL